MSEEGGGHKGGGAPCHCISSDNHIREANGVSHGFVPTGRSRRVNTLRLSALAAIHKVTHRGGGE